MGPHDTLSLLGEDQGGWNAASPATIAADEDSRPYAACAGARQPSAGKGPSDEQLCHCGRSRAPGRAGRRARQGVIQRLAGPPAAAQAGRRWPAIAPAIGLLWFAVTLRPAGQGLGWAVPAYLALAFVCLVLAVTDAATPLLPNRITYPAFPVVAGLLLAASLGLGELGRLGRGLLAGGLGRRAVPAAGAAVSARHGGGRCQAGPDLGPGARLAVVGDGGGGNGGRLLARRPGGAGGHGCAGPVAQGAAAVRPLAGRRGAAGRPGRRRGRRLVPGRLARRQVGRVSSCGR